MLNFFVELKLDDDHHLIEVLHVEGDGVVEQGHVHVGDGSVSIRVTPGVRVYGDLGRCTPTLEKNFAPKKVPKNVFLGISFVT